MMGRMKEAEKMMNHILNENAQCLECYRLLSAIYSKQELYAKSYKRAVELNPDQAQAWMNMGGIEHIKGSYITARDYYKKALQLVPNSKLLKENLAKLDRLEKRFQEVEEKDQTTSHEQVLLEVEGLKFLTPLDICFTSPDFLVIGPVGATMQHTGQLKGAEEELLSSSQQGSQKPDNNPCPGEAYLQLLTPTEACGIVESCDDCHALAPPLPAGVNLRGLRALELWQTNVTQIAEFGRLKYAHVTVDTFSSAMWASTHTGEKARDVIAHWRQAFAVLGIPSAVKTDNGPAYASQQSTRDADYDSPEQSQGKCRSTSSFS
ncbi:hypothetical protein DV515_00007809 [Chloebia gouldiae]|uniref:Integrase catalytic domain-containing protein n=1 Tax=Chloebia gouldiae TaxID=44316 RepID=A0A3L8SGR1_CHLGU|nr:hypothetical protein DV515_00007809 [Chloebia gouldiae]